ncbi:unnamed protein product [Oncorhynchus mykiss]|uniref:SEA domain-containing protein n=1 Tax=Oncorhynchus mykiss TaxID=8022 RepID=A0A060YAX1_ONCMY|nr:unnamed protein product [Oncorhynchus mykiss]
MTPTMTPTIAASTSTTVAPTTTTAAAPITTTVAASTNKTAAPTTSITTAGPTNILPPSTTTTVSPTTTTTTSTSTTVAPTMSISTAGPTTILPPTTTTTEANTEITTVAPTTPITTAGPKTILMTTATATSTTTTNAGPSTSTTAAPITTRTAAPTSTTTIALPTSTTTTATFTSTSTASVASTRFGTVVVFVRLEFQLNTAVPSKDVVLGAVDKKLSTQFRTFKIQRNTKATLQNATYIKLSDTSFAVDLGFKITNVSMEERLLQSARVTFTDDTYSQIQDSINSLLHDILSEPNGKQFDFPKAKFSVVGNQIRANVTYVYKEKDVNLPSAFLGDVLKVSGPTTTVAPTTTTSPPTTLLLTTPFSTSDRGFPGWALAIIIPCGIAIILVPLWILLCCMLCGGCAALRRRWQQHRAYNVQYTTRNGIF